MAISYSNDVPVFYLYFIVDNSFVKVVVLLGRAVVL